MNRSFIRCKEVNIKNKKTYFSLFHGIKNILKNIKILLSQELLPSNYSIWFINDQEIDVQSDWSLAIDENGKMKIVDSEETDYDAGITITKRNIL